ncbi:MAG: excinuclease ABC subunit UvrA [Nitrospiraceae bacterium]|nr:excinuclease ABC subunit UvrA [Nitrospiraceae bacterium]
MQEYIVIKGAREHNLKDLALKIPRQKLTVITGPSGSGKSSLAIDTIYAEGQRRYVESLSPYARQFLGELQKPEVDSIEGLSPSIAIHQKTITSSPRSTVGTITEIYDYARVLYTRIGKAFCYKCGAGISGQSTADISAAIRDLPDETRVQILSPIVQDRKGEYKKELSQMKSEGFLRARIDGQMVDLTEQTALAKYKRHTIEIVIDRLRIKAGTGRQVKNAVETALKYSDTVIVNLIDLGRDMIFSSKSVCPKCGVSYPDINPMFFSFNSRAGACPSCRGLGYSSYYEDDEELIEESKPCPACHGMRLRPEALSVKVGGLNIGEFASMSARDCLAFVKGLKLDARERLIAERMLKEITERLEFLGKVGLGYLTLARTSLTLSGGESQRIRLAAQMGSALTGVLYILDEPTIGLHPRDSGMLLDSLESLTAQGNTVIVVEHDEETMVRADHIVDMGPGAGTLGGKIVAEGSPAEIMADPHSLTGKYLKGTLEIPVPAARRKPDSKKRLEVTGARAFNLKNIDIKIPLGVFICVTGVSGSGKSTLVSEIILKGLAKEFYGSPDQPGRHSEIRGIQHLSRVSSVDQAPLGKTPRSNPATYTGVFSYIRRLFSMSAEAKVRGYGDSRFSFNVAGGRCETCKGEGLKKMEMHFLPGVYVPCDVCRGARYNKETLEIFYKGKNIAQALEMTISEASEFFERIAPIQRRLKVLQDVGLGYLKLGQQANTLSGGEAQRIRLSRELGKKTQGGTLYILDEPTTGLHFDDVARLLQVLNGLVDKGNTVLVVEHNLDVIKSADYIIDLGPEGGDEGGYLVACGTPEEVAAVPGSHTGAAIAGKLHSNR